MLRPSMQTLKHIVVNILIYGIVVNPLFGIPNELEDMRTKNIIESVTIRISIRTDTGHGQEDYWGRLDKVLATPGWYSLKLVSLVIMIGGSYNALALRKLPETQFPRFSSSNSILFDFKVNP